MADSGGGIRRVAWIVAGLAFAVAVAALALSLAHSSKAPPSAAAGTGTTKDPASTTTTAPLTPAGYASEACSTFDSADLFYRNPRSPDEVNTADKINRLAQQADQGDDATFGSLAADALNLYVDVTSSSGGSAGDTADVNMANDCNSLVERGIIH